MQKYAIITAGGLGKRFDSDIPKQFVLLVGKPVIFYSLETIYNFDKKIKIIISLHKDFINYWENLITKYNFSIPHKIVVGGETRFHSIKNALFFVEENSLVAVHDAARPFITIELLKKLFLLLEKSEAIVPVIDIKESIRLINDETNKSLDRQKYKIVQTPQVFLSTILKNAYKQKYKTKFTDDASIVENIKNKVKTTKGLEQNIKITRTIDLKIAEIILKEQSF